MLDGTTEGEQYKAHAFAAFASNHQWDVVTRRITHRDDPDKRYRQANWTVIARRGAAPTSSPLRGLTRWQSSRSGGTRPYRRNGRSRIRRALAGSSSHSRQQIRRDSRRSARRADGVSGAHMGA
jgi:hypothetical protein